MNRHFACFSFIGSLCIAMATSADAKPRTWSSLNGEVTLEGEMIASNDSTVILKRKRSGRLVAVELAELSAKDRAFVSAATTDASADENAQQSPMHTWTSRDGLKLKASIVAYGKKNYTLGKTRGVVTINGKAFSAMDPLHQAVALKVLSKLENQTFNDETDLKRFVSLLAGKPRTYPLEGVLMELASGDQIAVPFFMFSDQDLEVLKTGWESWQQAESSAQDRENLMLRSEAMDYQQSMTQSNEQQADYQRMEMLKLNMLAARTGLTSIWEVQMKPNPGVYGRPFSVMVPADNSKIATQMVLPNYPGYSLIGVRKASR
ncbi:hypothetical protein [Roseiconus lacunae]|uniref:SLA1 homology domain-containing protein n=1 Tax=Roseiconus lacunae TaxID=2605694 RepID=A0ABT7PHH7_9BACT|nr:hypothetical protein [Roseiconus lacunae]MCD0458254.1 hypothetical protein [Roseiconus lacunae]MDM4015646.1 hypothetical protein [Roseiconus lacunae]WRQ52247.1 hypothetical protein U8335_06805 [Stieleria sp. HD01]